MRSIFIFGILFFVVLSGVRTQEVTVKPEVRLQEIQDSTEYVLIISDAQFDTWFLFNFSEAKDHSNEYYRSKNIIASINWDEFYRKGKYTEIVNSYLNYQPHIDYGIELNRKLFWYFKYVQEKYHVPLH